MDGPYNTLNLISTNGVPNAERIAIIEAARRVGLDLSAEPLGNTLNVSRTFGVDGVGSGTTDIRFGADGVAFDVDISVNGGASLEVFGFNAGLDFSITDETITVSGTGFEDQTFSREDFSAGVVDLFATRFPGLSADPSFQNALQNVINGVEGVQTNIGEQERDILQLLRAAPDALGGLPILNDRANGLNIPDSCFGPEVPIDMWPLDPDLKPGPDGIYDQDAVRAKVWKKPIKLIQVGDLVVSFDDDGNLVPGPVTRTFQNNAKILLNFHGTRVTPGHVYYRPDSKKSYKYETLIDVLRDDGVIQKQDGTLIRAATNVPVDSPRDGFVRAVAGKWKADGTFEQTDEGRIRLGTRFLVRGSEEQKSFAVADLIERNGGVVGEDELIHVGDGPGAPLPWDFGDTLPKPEDFVLACSGTTLEDIYKAAEWESQGPRLPAPMVLDRGPVQPLKGAALSAMPRNEPLNVAHAPMAAAKPQRTLNRKQRKAMEAKQRKAAKARKRLVG